MHTIPIKINLNYLYLIEKSNFLFFVQEKWEWVKVMRKNVFFKNGWVEAIKSCPRSGHDS